MLRIIRLRYSGLLVLPDGTHDPFGPWTCCARKHARGYQAYVGGMAKPCYHDTLEQAVKDAVELALCGPVSNLRVYEEA